MKSEDYFRTLFKETKLATIMTSPVITIQQDEPFFNVYLKFSEHKIKHLIVVDVEKRVKGLVTLRDLYSMQSPKKSEDGSFFYNSDDLDRFILSRVMSKNPSTFHAQDSVGDAVVKMGDKSYGCLPIVDDKGVAIGVITQSDIIKIVAKILVISK